MTGRSVAEWIGKTPDTAVPRIVKARILLVYGDKCHKSGHKFRPGDVIEYDHVIALCNGGENRESNIAPILGGKVHQAKSRDDVGERDKTRRMYLKNLGQWPKGQPIRSRGFDKRRGVGS